jgi:polar amino acid transport system permease protein
MGNTLLAFERRNTFRHAIQVGLVWVGLLIILSLALVALKFDPGYAVGQFKNVTLGLWYTLFVSLVSVSCAAVLALLGALGRLSKNPIANGISGFYIAVIRGTPLLVQIYLIYLGLPRIGRTLIDMGRPDLGNLFILDAVPSGILALSLNYGAYMTEIFRAGIQSIGHGQREAAQTLGMTEWQVMRRIVLPQAFRIIIPDIGNQFIAMQKDSALVSIMGVWEITFLANRIARKDIKFMEMFILAAFLYLVLTVISSWLQQIIENRMAHAYER